MIPNPPTPEERVMLAQEKEIIRLYKLIDLKDKAIMILCAALFFMGIIGLILGFAIGVS